MADEAFALSPISARAAMPGEADYDAISAAFMETSRGRWFLSEYAKRNRNADTRMVLDAVARIEANIAAQKDAAPQHALAEALVAIRQALDEARAAASAALAGAAVDQSLAPIRNGAQVIHETLSRLREIGVGGRIYDLMDSQVSAIETGCGQIASTDATAALSAAFDLIDQRIKEFESDDPVPSSVRETPPPPSATADEEALAATAEFVPPPEVAPEAAAAFDDVAATAEIEPAAPEVDIAHDDAVLDLIALEMAAPDFDEPDIAEGHVMATNSAEPDIIPQAAEPPQPAPIPQPSLGASLIAQGIVLRPHTSNADPLAPIRRMSQAEKIAFFS